MVKKLGFLSTATVILLFFSACNFLFSPMHGRENPNDWEAQIYDVFAAQLSSNTIKVSFPWRERYNNYDDEDVIEEAMMVYSVGKAIPVRTTPLPPDSGGSFGFDFENGQYLYTKEIDGLSEGNEVWFALYPRMGVRWLAPLYEKIEIKKKSSIPIVTDSNVLPVDAWLMDASGAISQPPSSPATYRIDNTVGNEQYLILQFDFPKNIQFTSAALELPFSSTNNAAAYPVITQFVEHTDDSTRLKLIDYYNESNFTLQEASTGNASIVNAMNAAAIYGSDTIVIIPYSGVSENSATPYGTDEQFSYTYEQY
ncbi:MAG: hypothetical protein K9M94_09770 [Spirochaetia bacterium]|nr:hypothetical protein [Spirochaetia bacterium]